MVTVRNIIYLLILSLVSCLQKTTDNYEKIILGEWTFVKEETRKQPGSIPLPSSHREPVSGYNFLPNNICENKLGYFKRIAGDEFHDSKTLFLGTTTNYKIEKGSLKIYNPSDSSWTLYKIVAITLDTLSLQKNDSAIVKYAKTNYRVDQSEHYDEIIISASGCYGTCPINDMSINKNGDVVYFGDDYNMVNGYYKSKVNSSMYLKLEDDFKKANIQELAENYMAGWTDDETVSVSFIKDNKIIKTVSDYGRQSPAEFFWAYTSARYLYQQITLDSLYNYLNYSPFKYAMFESGGLIYEIPQSEGFYLWTLLLKSNITQMQFKEKYLLINNWHLEDHEIKTDGRFFKFSRKGGVTKIYDLGFNYIILNGLDKKFRPKNGLTRF